MRRLLLTAGGILGRGVASGVDEVAVAVQQHPVGAWYRIALVAGLEEDLLVDDDLDEARPAVQRHQLGAAQVLDHRDLAGEGVLDRLGGVREVLRTDTEDQFLPVAQRTARVLGGTGSC